MLDLANEIYQDSDKAREHLEAIHWPNGPICQATATKQPSQSLLASPHAPASAERAEQLIAGARDRRLTYQRFSEAAYA